MKRNICINLSTKDIEKSKKFFQDLGLKFNSFCTDETTIGLEIEDNIFVLISQEDKFKTFTKKEIVKPREETETILSLELQDKEEVDNFIEKAISLGARESNDVMDLGWMYCRQFEDLDGHLWEAFFMNEKQRNE